MRRFLHGAFWFGLGLSMVAGILIPAALWHVREKEEFWRYQGRIDGLAAAVQALEREFGRFSGDAPCRAVFGVKDETVVSVVVDGTKTVRVQH